MDKHNIHDAIDKVLIDTGSLQKRIKELAKQITEDYKDKTSLVLICILKGASPFMWDLAKKIELPLTMEFMSVSSYGDETVSSGNVKIDLDLKKGINGQHVMIVEDIIDTGLTMMRLIELLASRQPASLKVCSLLRKINPSVKVQSDYIGFEIPKDAFVIGYGLDFAEKYRNLDYIGTLKREYYEKSAKNEHQLNV